MRRFTGRSPPGPTPRAESPLQRATLGLRKLLSPQDALRGPLIARRYRAAPLCTTSNSAVLFARDEWRNGREVVLKILEGEAGADEAKRWAQLEQLDPRAVAPVVRLRLRLAVSVSRSVPRTVLVFDRLTPLSSLLSAIQTIDDVAAIAQQVGAALAFLHARGIVHADVKLENVLAVSGGSSGGEGWQLRLGDFGSAVWPSERAAPDEVGTLTHRAPELLLRLANSVAAPSDVWAWGCVVLELYSRSPLFPHPNEARLTRAEAEEHVLSQLRGLCGPFPAALSNSPDAARQRWLFTGSEPGRLNAIVKHVELASLLECLLQPDPALRLSAISALQMPLFAKHYPLRLLLSSSPYPPLHPSSRLPLPPAGPLLFAPLPASSVPSALRTSSITPVSTPLPSTAQSPLQLTSREVVIKRSTSPSPKALAPSHAPAPSSSSSSASTTSLSSASIRPAPVAIHDVKSTAILHNPPTAHSSSSPSTSSSSPPPLSVSVSVSVSSSTPNSPSSSSRTSTTTHRSTRAAVHTSHPTHAPLSPRPSLKRAEPANNNSNSKASTSSPAKVLRADPDADDVLLL